MVPGNIVTILRKEKLYKGHTDTNQVKQSLAGFYKMIGRKLAAKTLEDLLSSMLMRPKGVIVN